jgi:redox-sensitive bicupin YhaK (pirin superfamily)
MFGIRFLTTPGKFERLRGRPAPTGVAAASRRIALLRSGRRHGPMTRLITPWDVGELTQPFVFLGYSELAPGVQTVVGAQSGIAVLTLVLSGALAFGDASGNKGTVVVGGFNWTMPGEVVWHTGVRAAGEPLRAFQLWVELPLSPASSAVGGQCVTPHEVQEEGPVTVALGQLDRARSPLTHAPRDINYFHVRLRDRQCWRYAAPDEHNVTWLAVDRGGVRMQEGRRVFREQIAVFEDSQGVIELQADGETSFVLGSARRFSVTTGAGGAVAKD